MDRQTVMANELAARTLRSDLLHDKSYKEEEIT